MDLARQYLALWRAVQHLAEKAREELPTTTPANIVDAYRLVADDADERTRHYASMVRPVLRPIDSHGGRK